MFRIIADSLVAALLAPACAVCERPLEAPTRGAVCAGCWAAVVRFTPPLCLRCGDPLPSWRTISIEAKACARCRRHASAISISRAIGAHEGPLRAIVHALKYDRRRSLAVPLADLMRRTCAGVLESADLVVPVPLHRGRRRERGFNQAEDIASGLGVPVACVLRRARATPSQTDLPAARRHANVRGAFALSRRSHIRGMRVVLVDDVCTTGATLEACADVLRAGGAADVRAVTAARVVSRPRE